MDEPQRKKIAWMAGGLGLGLLFMGALRLASVQPNVLTPLAGFATPGGLITAESAARLKENLKNLQAINIGPGLHYIPEDNPHKIGEELSRWYNSI